MSMDRQRIVNLIVDYYVRQKNPFGWNQAEGSCMYKTPENYMCSIGFLANRARKLDTLVKEVEDKPDTSVAVLGMKVFKYVNMERTKENIRFLCEIQSIHDGWCTMFEAHPDHKPGDPVKYNANVTNRIGQTFIEELKDAVNQDYS